MSPQLVLSLFPGIGLLDMAFEEEGFCVARGPDVLWGGDIRRFHPPAGRFDGVIGGPPCQPFSRLTKMAGSNDTRGQSRHEDMIPEFVRVVDEARPAWFFMENVPQAHGPEIDSYIVTSILFNNRWLGEEQNRIRKFWFGIDDDPYRSKWVACPCCDSFWCSLHRLHAHECECFPVGEHVKLLPDIPVFESQAWAPAAPAGHAGGKIRYMGWQERARLQGVDPERFREHPFTAVAMQAMIGNGVPLAMGRAMAKAVRRAIEERR